MPIDLTTGKKVLGFGNVLGVSKTSKTILNFQFHSFLCISVASSCGVMYHSMKTSPTSKML